MSLPRRAPSRESGPPIRTVHELDFLRAVATGSKAVIVGPSLPDLCERTKYSPASVKRYIRELRARGLVADNDAHANGYALTPAGIAALREPEPTKGID